MLTGNDLIKMGYTPGPEFKQILETASILYNQGLGEVEVKTILEKTFPKQAAKLPLLKEREIPYTRNVFIENQDELKNIEAVDSTMLEVMRTPVVKAGTILPDAHPAGEKGHIPVGGVVASEAIHPGMHSPDICCSVAYSNFGSVDPKTLLDTVQAVTHFGPGGRDDLDLMEGLDTDLRANRFTKEHMAIAKSHLGTQGDGNHFAYVGTLKSTGDTILVTHHGSRGLGARIYKRGMQIAEYYRKKLSPETKKINAWIPADTRDGEDYWEALQLVRTWTKVNHLAIHGLVSDKLGAFAKDWFWNEHNFVFRKTDGLFYHAKGATPAFKNWAKDATSKTIIPLNMKEPILIVEGLDNPHSLGFSPHGAGRNYSRTQHRKRYGNVTSDTAFAIETQGIDARFYSGNIDITELPSAYKDADNVKYSLENFDLAKLVDEVLPYGCIMAGDWEINMPWRTKVKATKNKA